MQSGMPAEIYIKGEERTPLEDLLEPVRDVEHDVDDHRHRDERGHRVQQPPSQEGEQDPIVPDASGAADGRSRARTGDLLLVRQAL